MQSAETEVGPSLIYKRQRKSVKYYYPERPVADAL